MKVLNVSSDGHESESNVNSQRWMTVSSIFDDMACAVDPSSSDKRRKQLNFPINLDMACAAGPSTSLKKGHLYQDKATGPSTSLKKKNSVQDMACDTLPSIYPKKGDIFDEMACAVGYSASLKRKELSQTVAVAERPSFAHRKIEKLLSDGGYSMIDAILYKIKHSRNLMKHFLTVEVPKIKDKDSKLIMKEFMNHLVRDPRYPVRQITSTDGRTTYGACVRVRYVETEFTHNIAKGCIGYTVNGCVMMNSGSLYLELSEKNGNIRLEFIQPAETDLTFNYDDLSPRAYPIFRRKLKKFEEKAEARLANFLVNIVGGVINEILSKDKLFH